MPASAIASMLGGIVGTLGNLFGGSSSAAKSAQEAEKNRQFQAYEASINRDFNADEAQKNRDFQMAMYNSTNQYNDPSSVMKRLDAAGINPALAYSGGQLGTASMQGGSQASSSASPSGAMADYSGLQRMFDPLTMSQVHLNEAQARKLNSEADYTDKQTSWYDVLSTADANLKDATASWTDKQRREYDKIMQNVMADTRVKNSLDLIQDEQYNQQVLETWLKSKTIHNDIVKYAAEAKISYDQAKLTLGLGLSLIAMQNGVANAQKEIARLTGFNADIVSLDAAVAGPLYDYLTKTDAGMGIITDFAFNQLEVMSAESQYKGWQSKEYLKGTVYGKMIGVSRTIGDLLAPLGQFLTGNNFSLNYNYKLPKPDIPQ